MKTRIVYPKLWFDENFADCSIEAKVLFLYLITCDQLSLTRYHHITDRQIIFDTGLTIVKLRSAKDELTNLGWCHFTKNWVFHNHKCAYVDYSGGERVLKAKKEELNKIPQEIKQVFKGLMTGQRPNLNHKSETINPKPKIIRRKYSSLKDIGEAEIQEMAEKYSVPVNFVKSKLEDMTNYCQAHGRRYKNYLSALRNFVKKDAINHKIITPMSQPAKKKIVKPEKEMTPHQMKKARKKVLAIKKKHNFLRKK